MDLRQQLISNRRKTIAIICLFILIICFFGGVVGYLVAPRNSVISYTILITLSVGVVAIIYSGIMIHFSVPLIMKMNHANQVQGRSQAPELWDILSEMSIAAGIPQPKLYVIQDLSPNAFSTGNLYKRNGAWHGQSAVGVTLGIINLMNREELESVVGHEMGHIKDGDTRVESIGIALTSIFAFIGGLLFRIAWFASWLDGSTDSDSNDDSSNNNSAIGYLVLITFIIGLVSKLCCGLSYLTQLMLSRNREYLADAESVNLTRDPQALIDAFKILIKRTNMKDANPNCNSLYIVNPHPEISRKRFSIANIFDTHPSISSRIQKLQNM